MEVREESFVHIVAPVNVKAGSENGRDMVRSSIDVFAFNFDFSPSRVEANLVVYLNHQTP